jgi:hypothetical protein
MSLEDRDTQGLLDGAEALVEETDGRKRAWGEEAVPLRDRAAREEEALRTRRIEAVRAAQPRRFSVSPRALAAVGLCGLAVALVGVGASALGGSGGAAKTASPSLSQLDSSRPSTPAPGQLVRRSKARSEHHRAHSNKHRQPKHSRPAPGQQAEPRPPTPTPAPTPTPVAEPIAAPAPEPEAAPEPQASPPAPPPSQSTSSASAVSREFGFER